MDNKSTDSLTNTTEDANYDVSSTKPKPLENIIDVNPTNQYGTVPTYMAPIDKGANQDHKYQRKRKLSWVGLIIGLCLLAYSISQFIQTNTCTEEFCGLLYGIMTLISIGISLIFLIPSIAVFVISSKSYRDTTKPSIIGIIYGIIVTLLSILVSAYPAAVIGRTLTDGSTWYNFLGASMIFIGPLVAAGLLGTFIGLRILFKSLRISKRKLFTYLSFIIVIIGLICFGIFSHYSYKTEMDARFKPTNSASIIGNYTWRAITLDDGSIKELEIKFDVKSKEDRIITALLHIDGGMVARKDGITLIKGQTTNITLNIPILKIINTRNNGNKILTDGKFTVTRIILEEDGGDYKKIDDKTNVISGELDPQKIEYNTLTLQSTANSFGIEITGTAYSQLHEIKIVQVRFEGETKYRDLVKKTDNNQVLKTSDWYGQFNDSGSGRYRATGKMLDANDKEIILTDPSNSTTSIYLD